MKFIFFLSVTILGSSAARASAPDISCINHISEDVAIKVEIFYSTNTSATSDIKYSQDSGLTWNVYCDSTGPMTVTGPQPVVIEGNFHCNDNSNIAATMTYDSTKKTLQISQTNKSGYQLYQCE